MVRILTAFVAAATVLVLPAAPAAAAKPDITWFDDTVTLDVMSPADCFAGTQHVIGAERTAGQAVAHPDGRISLHGTVSDHLAVQFSNGWTGTWTGTDRFSFTGNGTGSRQEFTNVHRDTTQVYDQTGAFVGKVTFRVVEHFTVVDATVRVDFSRPSLTCDL